jgi:hypothetical protein
MRRLGKLHNAKGLGMHWVFQGMKVTGPSHARGTSMKNFKHGILLILCGLMLAVLSGCVEDARTGLICPPGTHPGPHGHQCFAD